MKDTYIGMLGLTYRDKVTGFVGVVTTVSFDLYGCIQMVVTPPAEDGKVKEGGWFDYNRLELMTNGPVMAPPNFDDGPVAQGERGCAIKPLP